MKPTLKQKVEVYEIIFHQLHFYHDVAMNNEAIKDALRKISAWSYAHRSGNGEYSQKEKQEHINKAFENLRSIYLK